MTKTYGASKDAMWLCAQLETVLHSQDAEAEAEKAAIARRERERLRMQDKAKRDNLDKLRAQQNQEAADGEVGGCIHVDNHCTEWFIHALATGESRQEAPAVSAASGRSVSAFCP